MKDSQPFSVGWDYEENIQSEVSRTTNPKNKNTPKIPATAAPNAHIYDIGGG